jgi:hypothetical protein
VRTTSAEGLSGVNVEDAEPSEDELEMLAARQRTVVLRKAPSNKRGKPIHQFLLPLQKPSGPPRWLAKGPKNPYDYSPPAPKPRAALPDGSTPSASASGRLEAAEHAAQLQKLLQRQSSQKPAWMQELGKVAPAALPSEVNMNRGRGTFSSGPAAAARAAKAAAAAAATSGPAGIASKPAAYSSGPAAAARAAKAAAAAAAAVNSVDAEEESGAQRSNWRPGQFEVGMDEPRTHALAGGSWQRPIQPAGAAGKRQPGQTWSTEPGDPSERMRTARAPDAPMVPTHTIDSDEGGRSRRDWQPGEFEVGMDGPRVHTLAGGKWQRPAAGGAGAEEDAEAFGRELGSKPDAIEQRGPRPVVELLKSRGTNPSWMAALAGDASVASAGAPAASAPGPRPPPRSVVELLKERGTKPSWMTALPGLPAEDGDEEDSQQQQGRISNPGEKRESYMAAISKFSAAQEASAMEQARAQLTAASMAVRPPPRTWAAQGTMASSSQAASRAMQQGLSERAPSLEPPGRWSCKLGSTPLNSCSQASNAPSFLFTPIPLLSNSPPSFFPALPRCDSSRGSCRAP